MSLSKKVWLPVLGAFLAAPAVAAEWQIIRQPTDGSGGGYVQLDTASIQREGNSITFWTRSIYPKPLSVPGTPSLKARVLVAQRSFDCRARTETLRKVVYLTDDTTQFKLAEFGPYPKDDVIPGMPMEDLFNLICRGERLPSLPPERVVEPPKMATSAPTT